MATVHLLRHGEVYNPERVLYGRLPGYQLSELANDRRAPPPTGWPGTTSATSSRPPSSALSRPPPRSPTGSASTSRRRTADRGRKPPPGPPRRRRQGAVPGPANWKYFATRSSRPGASRTRQIAERVLAAVRAAHDAADGRDAACVSHQLPIVCARRSAKGQRLFHDPRRRQCALASVTSFSFAGDDIVRVELPRTGRRAAQRTRRRGLVHRLSPVASRSAPITHTGPR